MLRGLLTGALGTLLGVALVLGVFFLWARQEVLSRMESRIEEEMARTRPLLAPPVLPEEENASFGRVSYNWAFTDLDGRPVSFEEYEGRLVFFVRWSTRCQSCFAELPTIERLEKALDDPRAAFLLVSHEEADTVRSRLEEHPTSLRVLLAPRGAPTVLWPERRLATSVIDCDGNIALRHVGGADWSDESVVDFLRGRLAKTCSSSA